MSIELLIMISDISIYNTSKIIKNKKKTLLPPYLAKIISCTQHICQVHHIRAPYLGGLRP